MNYIRALQALSMRAQMKGLAGIGPGSSENTTHIAKNGPCVYWKSRHFEVDLRLLEHINEVLPEDKPHQGLHKRGPARR